MNDVTTRRAQALAIQSGAASTSLGATLDGSGIEQPDVTTEVEARRKTTLSEDRGQEIRFLLRGWVLLFRPGRKVSRERQREQPSEEDRGHWINPWGWG